MFNLLGCEYDLPLRTGTQTTIDQMIFAIAQQTNQLCRYFEFGRLGAEQVGACRHWRRQKVNPSDRVHVLKVHTASINAGDQIEHHEIVVLQRKRDQTIAFG